MDLNKVKKENLGNYYNVLWFIKHIIISLISSVPVVFILYHLGFSNLYFLTPAVLIISFLLALLGDFIRKKMKPEKIITEGGAIEIIKRKIYWSIGPQFSVLFLVYVVSICIFVITNGIKTGSGYKQRHSLEIIETIETNEEALN